jgi:hypothetical protein
MGANDYFAGGSTLSAPLDPVSITADQNTAGFDVTPYVGTVCFILAALNTAGTDPTLDVALESSNEENLIGTITYSGTGNGKLTEVWAGPDAIAENITVTFSSATAFAVAGAETGAIGTGTVGTRFTSPQLSFIAFAGSTAFVNTDAFTVPVSARTYEAVDGAAFETVEDGTGIQRLAVEVDSLGKYLRFALDISGTDNPAYTVGIGMLGMKQYN